MSEAEVSILREKNEINREMKKVMNLIINSTDLLTKEDYFSIYKLIEFKIVKNQEDNKI